MAAVFLLVSFLLSLYSAGVEDYEGVADPEKVIEKFGDTPPTDEAFLDDRIIDLAVACNRNSSVNDRKAKRLYWAGLSLLSGIAAHAAYFLVILWPIGGAK